jgi:hypothetical protein
MGDILDNRSVFVFLSLSLDEGTPLSWPYQQTLHKEKVFQEMNAL